MRASEGQWAEAYFFLEFFASFLCQDKNEGPSDKTNIKHTTFIIPAHAKHIFQTTVSLRHLFAVAHSPRISPGAITLSPRWGLSENSGRN